MQEDELVGARWMPLEEYVSMPFLTSRPLLAKISEKCVAYADGAYQGGRGSCCCLCALLCSRLFFKGRVRKCAACADGCACRGVRIGRVLAPLTLKTGARRRRKKGRTVQESAEKVLLLSSAPLPASRALAAAGEVQLWLSLKHQMPMY